MTFAASWQRGHNTERGMNGCDLHHLNPYLLRHSRELQNMASWICLFCFIQASCLDCLFHAIAIVTPRTLCKEAEA